MTESNMRLIEEIRFTFHARFKPDPKQLPPIGGRLWLSNRSWEINVTGRRTKTFDYFIRSPYFNTVDHHIVTFEQNPVTDEWTKTEQVIRNIT